MDNKKYCSKKIGDKRCRRTCTDDFCWQHSSSSSNSSSNSPQKIPPSPKLSRKRTNSSSPKSIIKSPIDRLSESPRRVSFSKINKVKYIPPRKPNEKGKIHWAEEISDLQGICVSSVLDVYDTWDRETFEKRKYKPEVRALVDSCLKVMENKRIGIDDEVKIRTFAYEREGRRSEYIHERINKYNSK